MTLHRARLNPFEFRAGIYFEALKLEHEALVLIPLNSGLVFTWVRTRQHSPQSVGLNPFEFRAGIYFKVESMLKAEKLVLIPLNSGLVFTSRGAMLDAVVTRLNPFEFRTGIYFTQLSNFVNESGLNPFEFRAGIYFKVPYNH